MHLLLPLAAALAFAFGSMIYKRAFQEGAGLAHVVVLNNAILGIVFLPLILLETRPIAWSDWRLPALTALAFVAGHVLNVIALRVGDVSVATPLLGAKVIFVALIGRWVFGTELTAAKWMAASLATAGVVVMGLTDFHSGRRMGLTTAASLGCAAAFALTDTMIQAWGSRFGIWSFLALQFFALGILSAMLLPFFGSHPLRAPKAAWKWIFLGIGLSGLQSILVTSSIAIWQDAAGVNVTYATRGLWSIALVWFLGRHLQNNERQTAGRRRMIFRLAGASLLLAAVVLTARS